MTPQERIARIQKMEDSFNKARKAVDDLEKALDGFDRLERRIQELESYQKSGVWLEDFEADERGELPRDLLRGVLSEDGLDSLLSDVNCLRARLASYSEEQEEIPDFNPALSILSGYTVFDPLVNQKKDLPQEAGNYIVTLRAGSTIPGNCPDVVMQEFEGKRVIYTGVSAKNLRGRIGHDHFTGHSSFSTFRISLGCLMGFPLIHRDRIPDGKHYRFSQENEAALSQWMKENLIVYHKPSMYYEDIETMLILALNPPLNLDKNDAPVNAGFREHLKDLRSRRPAL